METSSLSKQNRQLNHFVVVGGGTAGWMTACLLAHHFSGIANITIVESSDIPTVGVGEGSTPHLKQFFNTLSISEEEWMPACNATFKHGIKFSHWSTNIDRNSYFHPFSSVIDQTTLPAFILHSESKRKGSQILVDSHDYFLTAQLALNGKTANTKQTSPKLSINYAYHFDAAKLAIFLKQKARKWGVKHTKNTVRKVTHNHKGDITSIEFIDNKQLHANFFVDCTGFQGLLINSFEDSHFTSYQSCLFNDRAIAIQTPNDHVQTFTATTSTALKNGWMWTIPLTTRMGNGYVYSSNFCEESQAEAELAAALKIPLESAVFKRLKMKVGRHQDCWINNCLAVGLSQGFIEPLEATALHLVQTTVEQFVAHYCHEECHVADNHSNRRKFNRLIRERFDGIRDYIVAHYKCTNREDTPYWHSNKYNRDVPDRLLSLLDVWQSGGNIFEEIERQGIGHYYSPVSWYCLLIGYQYGLTYSGKTPTPSPQLQQIKQKIEKWGAHFI